MGVGKMRAEVKEVLDKCFPAIRKCKTVGNFTTWGLFWLMSFGTITS